MHTMTRCAHQTGSSENWPEGLARTNNATLFPIQNGSCSIRSAMAGRSCVTWRMLQRTREPFLLPSVRKQLPSLGPSCAVQNSSSGRYLCRCHDLRTCTRSICCKGFATYIWLLCPYALQALCMQADEIVQQARHLHVVIIPSLDLHEASMLEEELLWNAADLLRRQTKMLMSCLPMGSDMPVACKSQFPPKHGMHTHAHKHNVSRLISGRDDRPQYNL